ncbi:hypothetical protein M5K25_004894 [Dendrobium thyrsiflorum]|uniref:DUF4283 domain-containing protein n=1 Tax=Dendrobium thyrsiflorum TaxID=117978 RepID=A0ABD0VG86_DENTH
MAGGLPSPRAPPPSPPLSQPPLTSSTPTVFLNMQPLSGPNSRAWTNLFEPADSSSSSPSNLNLSFYPSEPAIIPFSGDNLTKGADDWKLCLVGYSVGKRPFYEALLAAVKKTWDLKGSLQLLSLSDGFFLFRFSCAEDFDMIWSRGVWFILGRPFILQKWHPKFKPTRENLTSLPIWIKIHDLPLACWNSEGISRIASKVGIPLAADSLTSSRTRLTYARVCVLVDCEATYPDEIMVSLDGDLVKLKVQYEWRPIPCTHCKSLIHLSNMCPSRPDEQHTQTDKPPFQSTRGRSVSRKPRARIPNGNVPSSTQAPTQTRPNVTAPNINPSPLPYAIELPLHYQPHSPTHKNHEPAAYAAQEVIKPPDNNSPLVDKVLPNLNSPTEESSSSTCEAPVPVDIPKPGITSPNKFELLQSQDEFMILDGFNTLSEAAKTDKPKGTMAIPIYEESKYCLLWDNSELGHFGSYVKAFHDNIPTSNWANHLWFKGCSLRYSAFAWFCLIGGLKTAEALKTRNIYIDSICPLCRLDSESSRHLFFECQFSFNIILKLIPQANSLLLRPNAHQFFDWLDDLNCNADMLRLHKLITCCSIYLIWKERNDRRYGGNSNCWITVYKAIQKSVCAKVFKWKNGIELLDQMR